MKHFIYFINVLYYFLNLRSLVLKEKVKCDLKIIPNYADFLHLCLYVSPGDHSKITLKTKNVFIECTATDLTKVQRGTSFM